MGNLQTGQYMIYPILWRRPDAAFNGTRDPEWGLGMGWGLGNGVGAPRDDGGVLTVDVGSFDDAFQKSEEIRPGLGMEREGEASKVSTQHHQPKLWHQQHQHQQQQQQQQQGR